MYEEEKVSENEDQTNSSDVNKENKERNGENEESMFPQPGMLRV